MRILNVDDDADDREFFSDALVAVNSKIVCTAFRNGLEILDYLKKNPTQTPDYIFIDINMPKMNGHECAQAIKSLYPSRKTRIVMHSTAFNLLDIEKFEQQGYGYIVKQNSMSSLIKSIRAAISIPASLA